MRVLSSAVWTILGTLEKNIYVATAHLTVCNYCHHIEPKKDTFILFSTRIPFDFHRFCFHICTFPLNLQTLFEYNNFFPSLLNFLSFVPQIFSIMFGSQKSAIFFSNTELIVSLTTNQIFYLSHFHANSKAYLKYSKLLRHLKYRGKKGRKHRVSIFKAIKRILFSLFKNNLNNSLIQ